MGCSSKTNTGENKMQVTASSEEEVDSQSNITFNSSDTSVIISDVDSATEIEDYPYYYKEDYDDAFGNSYLYEDGNLVMCLSMVESYYERTEITPNMFLANHSELCKDGTESLNSTQITNFIESLGLGCVETSFELKTASDSLKTLYGCILLFIPHNSVYGNGGSYLLLTGISGTEFIVHDPSKRSENINILEKRDNQIVYNATTLTAAASNSSKMWIIY